MLIKPIFVQKYPVGERINNNLRNIVLNKYEIIHKLYDLLKLLNDKKTSEQDKWSMNLLNRRCYKVNIKPDELRYLLKYIGLYLPPSIMVMSLKDDRQQSHLPRLPRQPSQTSTDSNQNDILKAATHSLAQHLQTMVPKDTSVYDAARTFRQFGLAQSGRKVAIFVHCRNDAALTKWQTTDLYNFLRANYSNYPIIQISKNIIDEFYEAFSNNNNQHIYDILIYDKDVLQYKKNIFVLGLCHYYPNETDPSKPILDGLCVLPYRLNNGNIVTKNMFRYRLGNIKKV